MEKLTIPSVAFPGFPFSLLPTSLDALACLLWSINKSMVVLLIRVPSLEAAVGFCGYGSGSIFVILFEILV